jgi:transposase
MFLKVRQHKNKSYVSIVESVWEKGKSRHRNVASLGALPPELMAALGRKFLRAAGAKDSLGELKEIKRVNWGANLVYRHLWNLFELDTVLRSSFRKSKVRFNACEAVYNIVMDRLIEPSSKLQSYRRQGYYLGINHVDLQHYYRCLNLLSKHKDTIEEKLFSRNIDLFNMSVDIVFYDVTTLYFESVRGDTLKNFGFSKDHKFGEVQVVVGLLIDQEGRPVGFDVFPGNTFEGNTLLKSLEKLKKRFQIERVIIVADRGINSKVNLKAIRDAGYHYIVGSRLRSMPKQIQKTVLDLSSYRAIRSDEQGQVVFKMKNVERKNRITIPATKTQPKQIVELEEKLVCSWSLERAQKDRKDRERLIVKANDLVQTPSKLNPKRGAKRYVKSETNGSVSLDKEKIEKDKEWDGIYGIQCSELTMGDEDICQAYKKLWKIEESFRVLKTNLQTRPIFHWTPERIKGHLVTCFIAFLLTRTLELTLRSHKIDFSIAKINETLSKLEASLVQNEQDTFYLRSNIPALGRNLLKALKIKPPKSVFTELAT